jgi:hypothetical protein
MFGDPMSDTRLDAIRNLKMTAIRRCEERIEKAGKGSTHRINGPTPHFGVTSFLKARHGL